ncbi:MAG: hypothetical protein IJG68_08050 [Bacilli bacterium]|nr:hypothetical protein [Bacilli bacterium]
MKIRKFAYVLLTFGMIMIISGGFSSFLVGLKKDQELVYRRMEDVSAMYETFNTQVSLFGDYREDFHESVLENLYYDTMFPTDNLVKEEFFQYEEMVDEIGDSVKELDRLCKDVYYPKGEINNICLNYKIMYEQVINYFVLDVEDYNENVKKYNEYQASISSTSSIKIYSTNKKFIDYNGDKTFEGKE